MLKRSFLAGLGLLMIVALISGVFPAASRAQQGSGENFVFINYIGQEVVLDLDDVTYTVPGTATAPGGGRLALQLAPGEHKYAANVPGVPHGQAGEFIIEPGGYVGKAARLDKTHATLDRDGNVIEKPEDRVVVFDVDPFATPVTPAPVADTWQPTAAAPGLGSLTWVNYYHDELTVDLNGALYKVPPEVNNLPGRLQIDVPPGLYRYTASVPYGSLNGELNVMAGQVTGLNISAELRPEMEYDLGEPAPEPEPIELRLFQEDLTSRALVSPVADTAPGELPLSGGEKAPAGVETAAPAAGLHVKNYTGDTLIFTVNGQAYTIANDTEQILPLSPGQYNYTASLPYVARNGTVAVPANQSVELSIAINIGHDVLNIYQN